MQIQDIKELMDKMSQTGLTMLEYEADGSRLRLEKAEPQHAVYYTPAPGDSEKYPAGFRPQIAPADTTAPSAEPLPGELVTSPVVGVFYTAPSPDSDPFVSVGSQVEIGSPLCIIEAMKLMNEVTSKLNGTVLEILVENGHRVEYGQPLMRIGGL